MSAKPERTTLRMYDEFEAEMQQVIADVARLPKPRPKNTTDIATAAFLYFLAQDKETRVRVAMEMHALIVARKDSGIPIDIDGMRVELAGRSAAQVVEPAKSKPGVPRKPVTDANAGGGNRTDLGKTGGRKRKPDGMDTVGVADDIPSRVARLR